MSTTRKNILFLPKWYPHKANPFHGLFVHRHATVITPICNVYVLFARSSNEVKNDWYQVSTTIEDDVHVTRYYYKSHITGIKALDRIIKLWLYFHCISKGLKQYKKQHIHFNLAHIHMLGRTGRVALYLKRKWKLPYVVSEHFSGYFPERNEYHGVIRKWLDRKVCKDAASVVTVSQRQQEAMQSHGLAGVYTLIPNVVNTDVFHITNENRPRTQFVVIADQDDRVKNISGIINAFQAVASIHSDVQLRIIGGGVDLTRLQAYAISKAYGVQIYFEGAQSQHFIVEELNKSLGLVLFSHFENAPCVISEANACGVPVIVSNVGGVSELIDDKRGILVHPKDEKALSEAMIQLLNNQEQWNRMAIRQYVVDHYSNQVIGNQLNELYDNVLK